LYHNIKKTCEYGVILASLYAEKYNNDSYIGIVFRLTDEANYMAFEMSQKFCRLRKVVDGKFTILESNSSCHYKKETWFDVII